MYGILWAKVVNGGIAGLAGLACSLNHTDEADRSSLMNQLPATCRGIQNVPMFSSSRALSGIGKSLREVASNGKPKTMNCVFRSIWGSLGGAVLLSVTLSACGTVAPAPVAAVHRNDPPAGESSVVQSLQRQLRERDKRIEALASQLNALKLIDQDVEKRKKPSRSPMTLTPIE